MLIRSATMDGASIGQVLIRAKASFLHQDGKRLRTTRPRIIARQGFSTAIGDAASGIGGNRCRHLAVRALVGMVDLRSNPVEGTIFTLRLPVTLAIIPALMARL